MGTIQRQNGTNGAENHGLYRLRSKNFRLAHREDHLLDLERRVSAEENFVTDEEGRRPEGVVPDRTLRIVEQSRLLGSWVPLGPFCVSSRFTYVCCVILPVNGSGGDSAPAWLGRRHGAFPLMQTRGRIIG